MWCLPSLHLELFRPKTQEIVYIISIVACVLSSGNSLFIYLCPLPYMYILASSATSCVSAWHSCFRIAWQMVENVSFAALPRSTLSTNFYSFKTCFFKVPQKSCVWSINTQCCAFGILLIVLSLIDFQGHCQQREICRKKLFYNKVFNNNKMNVFYYEC